MPPAFSPAKRTAALRKALFSSSASEVLSRMTAGKNRDSVQFFPRL